MLVTAKDVAVAILCEELLEMSAFVIDLEDHRHFLLAVGAKRMLWPLGKMGPTA